MKKYVLMNVTCPFCSNMISKQPPRIYCEGISDNTFLAIRFENIKDFEIHKQTYCERFNESCYIYQLLMEKKYGENDNG